MVSSDIIICKETAYHMSFLKLFYQQSQISRK